MSETPNNGKVRINTEIGGEPAQWLTQWKNEGLSKSNTDVINRAFALYHEHIVEQDIKANQLKTIRNNSGEQVGELSKSVEIKINTVIAGEPAKWLNEWKERGLVGSNTDAVIQALRFLHEHHVEQSLKEAQRKTFQEE